MHCLYSNRVLCCQRSHRTSSVTSKSCKRLKISLEKLVSEGSQLEPLSPHLNTSTPAAIGAGNCQDGRRLPTSAVACERH